MLRKKLCSCYSVAETEGHSPAPKQGSGTVVIRYDHTEYPLKGFRNILKSILLCLVSTLCHPRCSAENQTTPKRADVKTKLRTTIVIEAPVVSSQRCLHTAKRDLFPHNQLTLCQPGKMPPGSPAEFEQHIITAAPLKRSFREAAKACTLAARISSIPKHFMLSSVTANWWVSIPGLRLQYTNTHAHTQACMHTHIWVCVVASRSLPGLGPVPGSSWALHRIKSSSVPRACCTGFRQCSPSVPQTIPIVLLFNEEELTWKNWEG